MTANSQQPSPEEADSLVLTTEVRGGIGDPSGETVGSLDRLDVELRYEVPSTPDCDGLERLELFGLDMINADSLDPVIENLLARVPPPEGRLPLVLTPNVDILVHLDRNQGEVEGELFRRAQYCLPDGQPIVAASHLLGRPLRARLTGSDLFAQMWPRIVVEQIPVVVVASSAEIAANLADEVPAAEFVVPPYFDATDQVIIDDIAARVLDAVDRIDPHFVLIGIGNPKDARIIGALLDRWGPARGTPPPILALGGSFALYLHLIKRAPVWMQRWGLEWFHRFLQEPRRLFNRYFVRDVAFLPIVWRERSKVRQQPRAKVQQHR